MSRHLWVVERKRKGVGQWRPFAPFVYSRRREAREASRSLNLGYPHTRYRVVKYVPEQP